MRMMIAAAAVLAFAGAARAHEVKAGPLTLSELQVRSTIAGVPTTAAYLTIANGGSTADRLLSVDCACAGMAMMHETRTKAGISTMVMTSAVDIPAGGKVVFGPTGRHIMLTGVKAPLKAGGMQELVLHFEKAGTVRAGFHVRDIIQAPGAEAPMAGMKH